ncbi:uncharacterized protein At2g34460, chloroplastic isoform X2 [Diospyros lotus]|uniref:uncharacterized protein At2g34460, chloroplastic isoform X2 n=1 Tax=Diospyros lotus TaxID=55363 RepID=UPI002254E871|nr:uncharacterized protein At2g34460, chloroplastic isoform X2 [Diospyros lotus]
MATSLFLRTSLFHSLSFSTKPSSPPFPIKSHSSYLKAAMAQRSEITEKDEVGVTEKKKIFVAGATGNTGKRIVQQLLAKGFAVKAGVRDVDKAKSSFSDGSPDLQIVKADVTEGSTNLAHAIGDDSDAVICATGFQPSWDLLAPWKVDNFGTVNLVEACRKRGVNRFILISSILVNGAAMGQLLNPAYIFLNVFGLTLVAKLQAEQYIRRSGINYTIIRPGGLRNDPPNGNIVMEPEVPYLEIKLLKLLLRHCFIQKRLTKWWKLLLARKLQNVHLRNYLAL